MMATPKRKKKPINGFNWPPEQAQAMCSCLSPRDVDAPQLVPKSAFDSNLSSP